MSWPGLCDNERLWQEATWIGFLLARRRRSICAFAVFCFSCLQENGYPGTRHRALVAAHVLRANEIWSAKQLKGAVPASWRGGERLFIQEQRFLSELHRKYALRLAICFSGSRARLSVGRCKGSPAMEWRELRSATRMWQCSPPVSAARAILTLFSYAQGHAPSRGATATGMPPLCGGIRMPEVRGRK